MASSDHSDDGDAIMMLKRTSLEGYPIKDACGNPECVVMTTFNGRVYTCDPTGVSQPENYVEVIFPTSEEEDEPDVDIVSVCCGRHRFLALSANGLVYSWSKNNIGQLGIRKKKKKKKHHNRSQTTQDFKPRLIEELSNYDVIQIACGDDHSLALTRDRRLFSWGCNLHGQLGVKTKEQAKPFEIEGLWGIPLQHIAAGGAHSVALSTTGSIFVWGSNTHGQLGLQQLDDVKLPVKLGSLSQGNVKAVSCGMHHTSFLQQNGQLLVYGMGVDRRSCESDEWGESELRAGRPKRFRTFSFLQSTSRCTYAVDDVTHGIFVLDHDKVQEGGGLQLEPLEGSSMIDVFEPESSTDWPPGRYAFDPKVWEPSRPVEDYERIEKFGEGTHRDDVADTNTMVRETEQQERTVTDSNHGDSDGCTNEAQDTTEHDSINDRGFGGFYEDCNEDFFDCSSSIDDAYSDDDSFVTCDEDYISISCDAFHDDPGVRCSHIDEQEDMSRNHTYSVETSPEPHSKSFDEYRQSTKDNEGATTDMDRTATELHSRQSGSNISKSNTCSEERIVILSSDAATHPAVYLTLGTADTAEEGVSVMNEPALHIEHPVPFEDGITDLSATLDAISVTNDHACPARETLEDVSGEADVGQENNQRPPRTWRRLCAGQEKIFIIEQDEPMRKDVQITINPGKEIDTLSAELLQSLSDVGGDITEEDALFQYASMVFSSPACLNASFRQTGPNEVNGLNVDLKAARRAYEVISKNEKLLKKLSDVISVDLCNIVPQSILHVEALRFIFVLMECPVFSNPHRPWGRRALAAADRLMGLLYSASKAGENKANSATPGKQSETTSRKPSKRYRGKECKVKLL
ncbi:uncharacterized protein LOC105440956 [Strongylocentrotus purpuratus]|uniref:RCC1-like domain-containing protein n=1 Tax=Strongylocentrotus purpuratus TaxID=7668 RepID=A0A7M7NP18_STRPU|nr:uncharacterized protein LOC105440956 [Strongylocentrotus purpuratus]